MTEISNEHDFDFEGWLSAARRPERSVVVYGRADLLADIDQLEAELRAVVTIPDEDRAMGDASGSDIEKQIDALYEQMGASKMVIRVKGLIDNETELIRDKTEAEADVQELMNSAASKARADARKNCARAEVKAVNDVNAFVRNAAIAASSQVLQREADLRILAEAIVSPKMSVAGVRAMLETIGEPQVNLVKAAQSRASNEAPKVALPK